MTNSFPDLTRRELLLATGGALCLPPARPLLLPGPYRGRVIETTHRDSVANGQVNQDAIRSMMQRGMCHLTGEKDEGSAWSKFVEPKDVVGVKLCAVGQPAAISQPETIAEVVRGLRLAGVKAENIVLFNRYEDECSTINWKKGLPVGVKFVYSSPGYSDIQTGLDGYDPEVYVEFPKVMSGQDATIAVNRRSHLSLVVSKQVDKIINVCALKDHSCGGITMALKNMSHGFCNNVCRTHVAPDNWSDVFIPAMVGMRKIREKVVLHIGDGLIGCYDGGPGTFNKHFRTWEQRSIFFATDPVAMDRIGWTILDEVRQKNGLPKLAESGKKRKNPGNEPFDYRQPEHVLIAGKAGLGEWDLTKIKHERLVLA